MTTTAFPPTQCRPFCRKAAVVVVVAMATLALVAPPSGALDLDAAARERLKAGEPITAVTAEAGDGAAGRIEAVIDIPAAPEQVWRILTNCDLTMKVTSSLKSCSVLSGTVEAGSDVREHKVGWSRLLPTIRSVFRSEYRLNEEIKFALTEGDLKRLDGHWRLERLDEGTRLSYAASLALGIPVPSLLVRSALESDMPRTLKAIRQGAIDGLGR